MKFAFLFQFFKDIDVCRNRLGLLKKFNPDIPVYGLYGGDPAHADKFKRALGAGMQDFFVFEEHTDPVWKWVHMDLLINSWFKNRGRELVWDTVIVVHWDQLILAPISELFPRYKKGEIILPGLRPVSEAEDWWSWLNKGNKIYGYGHYQNFLRYVKKEYGYNGDPLCFQGLLCFVPREFLEKFSQVPEIEHGYIEYRMAVYAQIFKTPFCEAHTIDCWWPTDPDQRKYTERHKCMHASKKEIGLKSILRYQKEKGGQRLFHPYRRLYPLSAMDWAKFAKDRFFKPDGESKHISIKRDI